MTTSTHSELLEEQIDQWRSYLRGRQVIQSVDVAELEDHLREQINGLITAGLSTDEAFLVAVKRMGDLDSLTREFAREHSDRLWKQLMISPAGTDAPANAGLVEVFVVVGLAIAAGLVVKIPALFGLRLNPDDEVPAFYFRNASLFVFPLLTIYLIWKRQWRSANSLWLVLPFAAGAVFANIYPWPADVVGHSPSSSHTEVLTRLHLPIALWMAVGFAYVKGRWFGDRGRMNFVRFSGELAIYYVLMALGGGVLTAFTFLMFTAIRINPDWFVGGWLLPCGAAGAVIIGSWLVEAKQSVIENMAPVLTRLFTPLFTILLVAFLATMVWTGSPVNVEREVLIGFNLLLVLVVGLVLYACSARDPRAPPDVFDGLQLVLVISALTVDGALLAAIASRISEFGFTPNRVAALGENLILLVNLTWTARLYMRFLRGRGSFADLERWQIDFLPVYVAWAAIVVIIFPPLFRFQ